MSAESRSITADGVAADAWHRVHPVSPIINAWQVIAALVAIITYRGVSAYSSGAPSGWEILNGIAEAFHLRGVLMATVAVVIAVLVVSGLYSWLQWRATAYAVDGGAGPGSSSAPTGTPASTASSPSTSTCRCSGGSWGWGG